MQAMLIKQWNKTKLGQIHLNFEFSTLKDQIRMSNLIKFKFLIKIDNVKPTFGHIPSFINVCIHILSNIQYFLVEKKFYKYTIYD